MAIKDGLLAEFDHEMAGTRRLLERLPEDKLSWKPHEKSRTLGSLAGHVAGIPVRTAVTLTQDGFDVMPPGAPPRQPVVATSRADLLATFDANVAAARAVLAEATDESLMKPWAFMAGGRTMRTIPRMAAFRAMVMSHHIHHRAQLGLYYRLNDVPVVGMYGPSADE
jgi:uncharacterized damage-inducible protein DinB